jgi:hypothetical protein
MKMAQVFTPKHDLITLHHSILGHADATSLSPQRAALATVDQANTPTKTRAGFAIFGEKLNIGSPKNPPIKSALK